MEYEPMLLDGESGGPQIKISGVNHTASSME